MTTSDLITLDDDALALVCGGDGDDPHGEEGTAGAGAGSSFMRDFTCTLAASVVGDAAGTGGLLIAAMIGGPVGVVLAPVLSGAIVSAVTNGARDACINSEGGPAPGGMTDVTAP